MNNIRDTTIIFNKLAFHLHPSKLVIIPTQKFAFLRFNLQTQSV